MAAIFVPLLVLSVTSVFSLQLDKVKLSITEKEAHFNETIYADPKGRYEIIKVPAHNDLDALAVLKDFKLKLAILKVDAQKRCWVKELEKDEEKPQDLEAAVKEVGFKFPSSPFALHHDEQYFPMGAVDPKAPIMNVATKFCGDYDVIEAKVYSGKAGEKDMEKLTRQEMMRALKRHSIDNRTINKRIDYGYTPKNRIELIRKLFHVSREETKGSRICSSQHWDEGKFNLQGESTDCGYSIENLIPKCTLKNHGKGKTCQYTVTCKHHFEGGTEETQKDWAVCEGKHTITTFNCCIWLCPDVCRNNVASDACEAYLKKWDVEEWNKIKWTKVTPAP